MVYPTLFPTDGGVVGQFTRTEKNEFSGHTPRGLIPYYLWAIRSLFFYANIKRTANGERKKENTKNVLITDYKANGVGLDIIKLMAYND